MVLFSLEMENRLIQTKVYYKRYSVWKETSHKPLKVTTAKSSFPVCKSLIQLASMNAFIPCDNWRHYIFFIQIYRYPEVWWNRHFAVFFETSVLQEVCILYRLSPQQHSNDANTKGPQQSFYFLNLLIAFVYFFSLWMFNIFLFKTQKLSRGMFLY